MDCCGQCPVPITDEEEDVAAEKRGIYVYGDLQFINDDPGRQAIGSFNPLTEDDWTEMAYVGNTARLCQAIVDGDLQHVQDWCRQADVGIIDRRDHTGRTSLHLAAMASTPEVVQCLIDHGARIVAQLVNGFTALHIAACRGNTQMVKAILERSEANEEEEAERADLKKAALKSLLYDEEDDKGKDWKVNNASDTDEDDGTNYDDDDESDESHTMTEGLFVKVRPVNSEEGQTMLDDKHRDELNVYDVNILAWDSPVSPLHLAILGGHTDVIETLCSIYGADVLLPVKILDAYSRGPRAAILTLILAQLLPSDRAQAVTKTLLQLGVSY